MRPLKRHLTRHGGQSCTVVLSTFYIRDKEGYTFSEFASGTQPGGFSATGKITHRYSPWRWHYLLNPFLCWSGSLKGMRTVGPLSLGSCLMLSSRQSDLQVSQAYWRPVSEQKRLLQMASMTTPGSCQDANMQSY
eukprot:1477314-Amphidinium_carterae.2